MKEDARGVVIHDNEKGKMLGTHLLSCVHASGDTSSPFMIVRTCMLQGRERSLCLS